MKQVVHPPARKDMQGKTINGYTLERPLGKGGMAEVWYAENEIGMKGAVKIMSEELSHNAQMKERFLNEAKVMVKLDHPNIRKVLGYGSIDDRPAIIMEYLDGNDLKARMKSGQRFTEEELERWWNQLADALNYTHAQDIVHRDIKPSNIFVDQRGNAKLLDFGIAKVTDTTSGTQTGSTLGTRIYMSPEQVKDPKRVGPKSDVYSLAVSFVHVLSGKAPYDSTNSSDYDIQVSIVNDPVDMSKVSDAWRVFLAPYLQKNPDQRPVLRHFEAVAALQSQPTMMDDDTTAACDVSNDKRQTPSDSKSVSEPSSTKRNRRLGLWLGLGAAVIAAVVLALVFSKGEKAEASEEKVIKTDVIFEVFAKDILKTMSHNSEDPVFVAALDAADQSYKEGQQDYISAFGEAFENIAPNASLAKIFFMELKDKNISINSSNEDVLKVLKEEYDSVLSRCCQIMQQRASIYCKEHGEMKRCHIKRVDANKIQATVEYKDFDTTDVCQVERFHSFIGYLSVSGRFEFYETYQMSEIQQHFIEADDKLAQTRKAQNGWEEEVEAESPYYMARNHPLFAKLQPVNDGSARVGIAQVKDTAAINQMLAETKNLFPRRLKLAWTVRPETFPGENGESIEVLDLVAMRLSHDNKCALGGEVITDARQDYGQGNQVEVTIQMNADGTNKWRKFTGDNIGRQIAIVIDDAVYSYPVVNGEIPNGRCSISGGGMTIEEAQKLAFLLKVGRLPIKVDVLEIR